MSILGCDAHCTECLLLCHILLYGIFSRDELEFVCVNCICLFLFLRQVIRCLSIEGICLKLCHVGVVLILVG